MVQKTKKLNLRNEFNEKAFSGFSDLFKKFNKLIYHFPELYSVKTSMKTGKKFTYLALPLLSKVGLLFFIALIFFAFAGASQRSGKSNDFEYQWKELI